MGQNSQSSPQRSSSWAINYSHVLMVETNTSDKWKLPLLLDGLEAQVVLLELVSQAGGGSVKLLGHIPEQLNKK